MMTKDQQKRRDEWIEEQMGAIERNDYMIAAMIRTAFNNGLGKGYSQGFEDRGEEVEKLRAELKHLYKEKND